MNTEAVYTTPYPYAKPESSPDAPGVIPTLRQPIYGEDGFDPTTRPQLATMPESFDITFEENLEQPTPTVRYGVEAVIVGVVGMPLDASPGDVLGVSVYDPVEDWTYNASIFWYGYPRPTAARRGRHIMTTLLYASMTASTAGIRTVTVVRATAIQVVAMRATYAVGG